MNIQPTISGKDAICKASFRPQWSISIPLRREPRGVAAEWTLAKIDQFLRIVEDEIPNKDQRVRKRSTEWVKKEN